eukprot:TRINITY_DN6055_c0_g1_i4.p1 TRINITY_DN6055_c0_g1~~TRINITY_DN6055_c0_g1_i4.p1  ORF type:complete len:489 (-),score=41.25 TRINITY_DN6055_c0_g1_i4:229-1695(-)
MSPFGSLSHVLADCKLLCILGFRAYFFCSEKCNGCTARKMVDVLTHDPHLNTIHYFSTHNHPEPQSRGRSSPKAKKQGVRNPQDSQAHWSLGKKYSSRTENQDSRSMINIGKSEHLSALASPDGECYSPVNEVKLQAIRFLQGKSDQWLKGTGLVIGAPNTESSSEFRSKNNDDMVGCPKLSKFLPTDKALMSHALQEYGRPHQLQTDGTAVSNLPSMKIVDQNLALDEKLLHSTSGNPWFNSLDCSESMVYNVGDHSQDLSQGLQQGNENIQQFRDLQQGGNETHWKENWFKLLKLRLMELSTERKLDALRALKSIVASPFPTELKTVVLPELQEMAQADIAPEVWMHLLGRESGTVGTQVCAPKQIGSAFSLQQNMTTSPTENIKFILERDLPTSELQSVTSARLDNLVVPPGSITLDEDHQSTSVAMSAVTTVTENCKLSGWASPSLEDDVCSLLIDQSENSNFAYFHSLLHPYGQLDSFKAPPS